MDKKPSIKILSTRVLDSNLTHKLTQFAVDYQERDFIVVRNSFNTESFLNTLLSSTSNARVFTSKNAVRSLKAVLEQEPSHIPAKKTFTVGIKATEMLKELGVETAAQAGNAISLAQIIARNKDVESVDFFCGNKSLNDLPEYLESKGIRVNKEIVYETDMVYETVSTDNLKGLICLSPTAVYSFFKKNKLDPNVPVFCIGNTTAAAVQSRCDNPRIKSDEPSIESVVDKVISYFKLDEQL